MKWTHWTAARQVSLSFTISQSLSWWCIQPSHPLSSPSPPTLNHSQHQAHFQMSQFFTSGGQSIRVSASKSVFLMYIQNLFILGWTGLIPLQPKGLSRVFSNTTIQNHQFFGLSLLMDQLSDPYMMTGKTIDSFGYMYLCWQSDTWEQRVFGGFPHSQTTSSPL